MIDLTLSHRYVFHGLGIAVECDHPAVSAALNSRLGRHLASGQTPADITFEFRCVPSEKDHLVEKPPATGRPVYESAMVEVVYVGSNDQLYLNYGDRVRALCDVGRGRTTVSIVRSETGNLWPISHPMFTLPLMEVLKRRGWHSLHAAGLSVGGLGLLVVGGSGSGKSTLAVTLLRAGFDFLGDDMIFLSAGRDGLRVLAFPDEVDLTDDTARMFPELRYLLDLPKRPGWPKRQVRAEEVYASEIAWECRPKAVVFPRVAYTQKSVLKPMRRDEAFLELVPNVLLTDARSSQAHLDALAELVRESECYSLEAGLDFDALPALLGGLLS